jgi:polyisoprenoid-binding protein YceI
MKKLLTILALVLAFPAMAKTWTPKSSPNKVEWTAVGSPGFLRINGFGGKVRGMLVDKSGMVSGRVWVDLSKYTTGSGTRDEHMHEKYLETGKFPKAVLDLNPVSFAEGSRNFTGSLKIKGKSKLVAGVISFHHGQGYSAHIKAKFDVSIPDYPSIGVPSWLGITVANKVEVTVDFIAEGK